MNKLYNIEEIKNLLEKYFEGETCSEEEKIIYHYFSTGEVAEELKAEQNYFLALAQVCQNTKQEHLKKENQYQNRRKNQFFLHLIPLSAVAAITGLIFVSVFVFQNRNSDYLVVNGVKTRDKDKMEAMFYASLKSAEIDMNDIWEVLKD
jgi:uncharacterized membrane protein YvbJ